MADFTPKKIADISQLNKGKEYVNGVDIPDADDWNKVIESQLWIQKLGENPVNNTEANNVGTAELAIAYKADGIPYFKAKDLKGEQGENGTGITSIEYFSHSDAGNIYKINLTDGTNYLITAPTGATGDTGLGIGSIGYSYGNSTEFNVKPSKWTAIPQPEQGKYTWTKIVQTLTDLTQKTFYIVTYSGLDANLDNVVTLTGNQSIDGYKILKKPIHIKLTNVSQGAIETGIVRCTLPSGSLDYVGTMLIDVDGSYSSNVGIRYVKNSKKAQLLHNNHYLEIPNKDGTLATLDDLPSAEQNFVTCSSSATSTAKTVNKDGFELKVGARITIKFTYGNTVVSPTLNVNSTGAKTIKADGDTSYIKWLDGTVMEFVYDGTNWVVLNGYQLAGMRVGHLYIATSSTSPATLFGGTWTQIPANYALWTATSGAGNTIAAGLPNIKGNLNTQPLVTGGATSGTIGTGALRVVASEGNVATGRHFASNVLSFNASLSNNIYGNSTTVQPPAYKVYAWRRTA